MDVDSHKVYLLYDYPHLFKSVRNTLLQHKIIIGEDRVDWDIIKKLHDQDSGVFKVAYKLTQAHVAPNSFEKLSVKLATQVFSNNVYSGILLALKSNCFATTEEKKVALSTATFIKKMNDLFDTLNTNQMYSRNPKKDVLSDSTDTMKCLQEARHWIATWKSTSKKPVPPCFKGLQQTLLGIELMWEHLRSDEQKYILLAHLNSDVAENVFSMVRNNRGSYDQMPSAWRFIRNLKLIMFQHLRPAKTSGYEDAGAETLLRGTTESTIEEYNLTLRIEDDIVKRQAIVTEEEKKTIRRRRRKNGHRH